MRQLFGLLALAALAGGGGAASRESAHGYNVEYVFKGGHDGAQSQANLVELGGKLYGTTLLGGDSDLGTVFSFDPSTGIEIPLYSFKGGADGASPNGGLVAVNGKLYGSTGGGGNCSGGCGTVYSFDPATGVETVLETFRKPSGRGPGPLLAVGNILYGTTFGQTSGTVFAFNLTTGAGHTLHTFQPETGDGLYPDGPMIDVGGVLYGVTMEGGSLNCGGEGCGTVFSIDPKTDQEQVVYGFTGGADGSYARGNLVVIDSLIYGTTANGGSYGYGTVFSVDPATHVEAVLYSFTNGRDGAYPLGLIKVGDALYGTTTRGGNGCGVVYSLSMKTHVEKVHHAFKCDRPSIPFASLLSSQNKLFGTVVSGGKKCDFDCGAVFSIEP